VCAQHRGSASPLKIAPGRRGRAAHRSSAPFFTPPKCHLLLLPIPHHPTVSLVSTRAPASGGPSALVESKSGLDPLAPPLAARPFSPPGVTVRLDFTDLACPTASWQGGARPPRCLPQLMPCMADPLSQIGIAADMPLLPRFASSPCRTPSLRFALFRGLACLSIPFL
jgi:hypothetical protein